MTSADDAPLTGTHAGLGTVCVRPYGHDHLLIDVAGPSEVSALRVALERDHPNLRARPGWSSVLVRSDSPGRLLTLVLDLDVDLTDAPPPPAASPPRVNDVVYDGPDLDLVASLTGLTPQEVITAHSAGRYRVVFLGFTRAFAYLDGLDPRLSVVPRLDTPRVRVPAGSVGIAAGQTGIYPMASPGGWHILGHTDTVLFDPTRVPPSLLAPGDPVRFRNVHEEPTA